MKRSDLKTLNLNETEACESWVIVFYKALSTCSFICSSSSFICALLRSCSCKGIPNMKISFVLTILLHFNTPLKRCKSIKIIWYNQRFSHLFCFVHQKSDILCFEWLYNRNFFLFRPPPRPLQPCRNHRQRTKNPTQNLNNIFSFKLRKRMYRWVAALNNSKLRWYMSIIACSDDVAICSKV